MKRIRRILASALIISTVLSGCSDADKIKETEPTEEEETRVVSGDHNRLYIADQLPSYDDYEQEPWSDTDGMVMRDELYVPLNEYQMVASAIVDYINNGGSAVDGNTYPGKDEISGIDELIEEGDPLNNIGVGYVDLDYDGIGELAILDMNDDLGYRVLELYAYDREYGISNVFSGWSQLRYYCSCIGTAYRIDTTSGSAVYSEFTFGNNKIMYMSYSYYIIPVYGVDYLYGSYSEAYIGEDDLSLPGVLEYGPIGDADVDDMINTYYNDISYQAYSYWHVTPLSEYV